MARLARIVVPDVLASRTHAIVHSGEQGLEIEDLHSINGTFVGGSEESHRLVKNQPRPLRNGDKIVIGTNPENVERAAGR